MSLLTIAQRLHEANAVCRQYAWEEHFYTIKALLLRRYANRAGYDYQLIEGLECWSCDGFGDFGNEQCNRCAGTGQYRPDKWYLLRRWDFQDLIFHQPLGPLNKGPTPGIQANVIKGRIEHDGDPLKGPPAFRFLCVLAGDWYHANPEWRKSELWYRQTIGDGISF